MGTEPAKLVRPRSMGDMRATDSDESGSAVFLPARIPSGYKGYPLACHRKHVLRYTVGAGATPFSSPEGLASAVDLAGGTQLHDRASTRTAAHGRRRRRSATCAT